jgi:hypothetical protein
MMLRSLQQLIRCIYQSQLRWNIFSFERDGTLVLGEIREHSNPKRYNDTLTNFQLALNVYFLNTTYYKENLDMLLNCCYVFYDLLQSWSDREDFLWNEQTLTASLGLTIVPPMTSRIGRESPDSLMVMLSATIHALTVGKIIVPVCASWSTTQKQVRKVSGSTRHHTDVWRHGC